MNVGRDIIAITIDELDSKLEQTVLILGRLKKCASRKMVLEIEVFARNIV